jgi:hypothetical protein
MISGSKNERELMRWGLTYVNASRTPSVEVKEPSGWARTLKGFGITVPESLPGAYTTKKIQKKGEDWNLPQKPAGGNGVLGLLLGNG